MTDQLERDLAQMFAAHADQAEIPSIPADLFHLEPQRPWGRRALAIGLVAAAAVVAVAVPLGLASREDTKDLPPTKDPTPVHGLEVPYLREGKLHVRDLALPTRGDSIETAGTSVLVVRGGFAADDARWQRLSGDKLEDLSYLDGINSVEPSYDGKLVAAPIEVENTTAIRVWDTASGDVVDTFQVADPPAPEAPVMVGFDAAGFLYWHDGATLQARNPAGERVTVDVDAAAFAGIAPGGVLVRTGDSDTVTIGAVGDDGSVDLGEQVPVSATAVWRGTTTVAYQDDANGSVYVFDVRTGKRTEVTVKGRPVLNPVGWSDDDLVVAALDPSTGTSVVVIDLATGDQQTEFGFGLDEPLPFGPTGGTGGN